MNDKHTVRRVYKALNRVVTHPSTNRGRRALTSVNVQLSGLGRHRKPYSARTVDPLFHEWTASLFVYFELRFNHYIGSRTFLYIFYCRLITEPLRTDQIRTERTNIRSVSTLSNVIFSGRSDQSRHWAYVGRCLYVMMCLTADQITSERNLLRWSFLADQ